MPKLLDLSNLRFGSLLAINRSGHTKNGRYTTWLCKCDCGKEIHAVTSDLKRLHTRSCGCLKSDELINKNTTHGMAHTPVYKVWKSMKSRCYNTKDAKYDYYGGRGISVCDTWINSFSDFLKDMGYPGKGMSLDRIDNNIGYSKSNCRWASSKEQARNTRRNRNITFNNQTKCMQEWADILNIPSRLIRDRLNLGWDIERAFTEKVIK